MKTIRSPLLALVQLGLCVQLGLFVLLGLCLQLGLWGCAPDETEVTGAHNLQSTPAQATCGGNILCLQGGRFRLTASWQAQGRQGSAEAVQLTRDAGYFWFFHPDNVELAVKVLDGREFNNHHWVFYGSLSDVEYELTVVDVETGRTRTYNNPPKTMASVGDTLAFPADAPIDTQPGPLSPTKDFPPIEVPAGSGDCQPSETHLCLQDARFRVEASWRDFEGRTGTAHARPLTADTGYFWFFNPDNLEVVVKVLDGQGVNDFHWVFYASLSNVEYAITVTDTATGRVRRYKNPARHFASVGDTAAFNQRFNLEACVLFGCGDVSSMVDDLGIALTQRYPSADATYARNVWDLKSHDGLLYIGSGNSSNLGPAQNAGPAQVWTFDAAHDAFIGGSTLPDEQIDEFVLLDGQLVIPGHDPRESWDLGNYYTLTPGADWVQTRTIPDGIHNYAMVSFAGRRWAGLGTRSGGVVVSSVDGQAWTRHLLSPNPGRIHTLFTHEAELYAVGPRDAVYRWVGDRFLAEDPTEYYGPSTRPQGLIAPLQYQGRLYYLAAHNVNDHQWAPFELRSKQVDAASRRELLGANEQPWDLMATAHGLLLVTTQPFADRQVIRVRVLRSGAWVEVLRFFAGSFVRSFELHEGRLYFGLGSRADEVHPDTGRIYRF